MFEMCLNSKLIFIMIKCAQKVCLVSKQIKAKNAEKLLDFWQIWLMSTEIRLESGVSEIEMFNYDLKVVFCNHK